MKKNTVIKTYLLLASALVMLSACQAIEKKQQSGAVAELHGHYLYHSTIDALTVGLNSEDSLRTAQQYITQWAKDILIYDEVKRGKTAIESTEIEQMVDDYRRTLYIHAYEDWLVAQQMPKTVLDSTVEQIYMQPDRFLLTESIVKGMLVIVPNDAPNIPKLRKWMSQLSLDEIEKYAYQIAIGYELFTDKWLSTTDIIRRVPIRPDEWEAKLKNKDQVEVSDSTGTYILHITDKQLRGTKMPMEFARDEIERIVLNKRQVEFLQKERDLLYEEAVQRGEIKFY